MATHSLLPNSAPHILVPVKTDLGTFQIKWIEELDSHALFVDRGNGPHFVASHHNGFSLHYLVEQIQKGNGECARRQLSFIKDCGGTTTADKFLGK